MNAKLDWVTKFLGPMGASALGSAQIDLGNLIVGLFIVCIIVGILVGGLILLIGNFLGTVADE